MRDLVLKMSMSVDGFVAKRGTQSDWMFRAATPDSGAWVQETLASAGSHIWGRKTFEFGAGFWPTSTSPMAEPTNAAPKVVFTSQQGYDPRLALGPVPGGEAADRWLEARVASGPLEEEIDRMKQEAGGFVLAQGGTGFARALVHADLVDEYRFVVLPVALGSGDTVFDGVDTERDLRLTDVARFSGGVLAVTYRRER